MQISNQNNSVNFTSKPLHFVNLKKLTNGAEDGFIKAVVSELDATDKIDTDAIEKLNVAWNNRSGLVHWFCQDFLAKANASAQYFVIEKPGSTNLVDKIVGLLQIYPQKNFVTKRDNLILSTLATKSEFSSKNTERGMKNIGEALLGETFNSAKEKNIADVKIYATKSNCGFYSNFFKNAGLSEAEFGNPTEENLYTLVIKEKNFDKCIKYYQNKFCSDTLPQFKLKA